MAEETIDSLISRGMQSRRDGDSRAAREAFARAEAESRRLGDLPGQARARAGLAQVARDQGGPGAALEHYRAASAIWRAQSNSGRLAHSLRHEADVLLELGRLDEAEPLYVEVAALYRVTPETAPLDLANAIRGHAMLAAEKGAREEAAELWRQARDLYRSAGVEAGAAESERRLAMLERA